MEIMEMDNAMMAPVSFNGRHISLNGDSSSSCGSAPNEVMVIFKFFGASVQIWKHRFIGRPVSFKMCMVDFKRKDSEVDLKLMDDCSSNINDYVNASSNVMIAVLNDKESVFKTQDQFGHVYNPNEYVALKASSDDQSKWAYMIDFYLPDGNNNNNSNGDNGETCTKANHIGYAYILPLNLQQGDGIIKTVITGINHKPIGQVEIEYLIVKPSTFSNNLVGMSQWSYFTRGIEVGHRGAGKWRRTDRIENVLENTIASFNYAAQHGADLVELDVHLSKDLVPVIYHDLTINIAIKTKNRSNDGVNHSDVVKIITPVKDLTLHQLQSLKLSPANDSHDFDDEDPLENQPFPTLESVLESVTPQCGFNVEIKYPMLKCDGSWDGPHDKTGVDINDFVDIILTTIIEHAGDRKIILSSFHPEICILLRMKQNKYPVLFLTQCVTPRYKAYLDPRTTSVPMATYFAKAFGLYGVNLHAEELLKDRSLVKFINSHKLALFCWGEDINSTSVIRQLKDDGVDGIIYDKIDVYNTKNNQFVAPDPETKRELMALAATQ